MRFLKPKGVVRDGTFVQTGGTISAKTPKSLCEEDCTGCMWLRPAEESSTDDLEVRLTGEFGCVILMPIFKALPHLMAWAEDNAPPKSNVLAGEGEKAKEAKGAADESQAEDKAAGQGGKPLKPCQQKAWSQFQEAVRNNPADN